MRDALLTRAERYNAELAHLAELEAQGKALVVRPETMPVKNTTLSVQDLELAFNLGHTQGLREWDRWEQFLRQA